MNLPVAAALPALRDALANSPAVILSAETGSGKTTWLPLQLIAEPWLKGKKIVMLEPRRVAARAAARRLAYHVGEKPGKTVGYSVRWESMVSAQTRVEVVTEGVLTRRLVADPELKDIGLVIFDEFHERHLDTDLALALTLESYRIFRADLKILIMSATISTSILANFFAKFFGKAENAAAIPVITAQGKNFPVAIDYHNETIEAGNRAMALACARKAIELHAQHGGDFLIFLPGVFEIFTAVDFLQARKLNHTVILPLYGEMTSSEQDRVLSPAAPGMRRIIVATPLAESSLTVEGLTVVIDSGLVRQPAFAVGSGLSYLETMPISQDAAQQRAGRAGRLGPGICYRMYSEAEFRRRPKTRTPEILRTDLADALLRTLAFGVHLKDLPLLDTPSATALAQAERLLCELRLMDDEGKLTTAGKKAATLPLPARLAAILAHVPNDDAALLSAMLSERVLLADDSTDLAEHFSAMKKYAETGITPTGGKHYSLEMAYRLYESLRRRCANDRTVSLARLLLYAYPDRIAARREIGSFVLVSGGGFIVDKADSLADCEFLVALDIEFDKTGKNSRLRLGISINRSEVLEHFADKITLQQKVRELNGKIRAYEQCVLGAIAISEQEIPIRDEAIQNLLRDKICKLGLAQLFGEKSQQLVARSELLRSLGFKLPDFSLNKLEESLEDWLLPYCANARSLEAITDEKICEALAARLSYAERRLLDENLPEKLIVPSGSAIRIRYSGQRAIVAVRLQEVFGLNQQPMLAAGKMPVTFELLSPGQQVLAKTQNLPAFWQTTYPAIRKEMRGQYPKHFWPEDPLSMQGTKMSKKAFDRHAHRK